MEALFDTGRLKPKNASSIMTPHGDTALGVHYCSQAAKICFRRHICPAGKRANALMYGSSLITAACFSSRRGCLHTYLFNIDGFSQGLAQFAVEKFDPLIDRLCRAVLPYVPSTAMGMATRHEVADRQARGSYLNMRDTVACGRPWLPAGVDMLAGHLKCEAVEANEDCLIKSGPSEVALIPVALPQSRS